MIEEAGKTIHKIFNGSSDNEHKHDEDIVKEKCEGIYTKKIKYDSSKHKTEPSEELSTVEIDEDETMLAFITISQGDT